MSGHDDAPVVAMQGIVKRFGNVVANDGVDFQLGAGEIHALLGENGAGKTTLMNILYGRLRPDAGMISVRGAHVHLRSAQDAIRLGIGMVHQHFMLVPTLTVAENMIVGERLPLALPKAQLVDVARRVDDLGRRYGLEVPSDAPLWQLSVGEQQRVEILRALYRKASILILDEPTAALAPAEVAHLLRRLRAMASDGASIVIITHHLDEVMACADRITILRRGLTVTTVRPHQTSTTELARLMVGRDVSLAKFLQRAESGEAGMALAPLSEATTAAPDAEAGLPDPGPPAGKPVLEVVDLSAVGDRGTTALAGVSFRVRPGEILGIAGVEGNGQTELEEVLIGLRPPGGGSVRLLGQDIGGIRLATILQRGMGYIPSDRYRRGLIRELSVAENLVLDRIDRRPFGNRLRIKRKAILEHATRLIRRFSILSSGPSQPAGTLSGGNMQRVVLARVLTADLRLLLASQPTRGLDVGAIEFVWHQLREQLDRGVGIVLISTDLDEVMALANRCHVMYRGQLVGEWDQATMDRGAIGLAMGGGTGPTSAVAQEAGKMG
jgi:ABC-type uncharacterized transport system ATPase subunit